MAEADEEPQKPSPKKVARTSKTKPPAAKVKKEETPPKSTVSVPASNTYGATRSSSSGSLAGFGSLSSSYGLDAGPVPDAMSEKDLVGNQILVFSTCCYVEPLCDQKIPLNILSSLVSVFLTGFLFPFSQGNEFFKEGKYVNAIECYSRSIALQPTAVAYANRAMAFLKIRR